MTKNTFLHISFVTLFAGRLWCDMAVVLRLCSHSHPFVCMLSVWQSISTGLHENGTTDFSKRLVCTRINFFLWKMQCELLIFSRIPNRLFRSFVFRCVIWFFFFSFFSSVFVCVKTHVFIAKRWKKATWEKHNEMLPVEALGTVRRTLKRWLSPIVR